MKLLNNKWNCRIEHLVLLYRVMPDCHALLFNKSYITNIHVAQVKVNNSPLESLSPSSLTYLIQVNNSLGGTTSYPDA